MQNLLSSFFMLERFGYATTIISHVYIVIFSIFKCCETYMQYDWSKRAYFSYFSYYNSNKELC